MKLGNGIDYMSYTYIRKCLALTETVLPDKDISEIATDINMRMEHPELKSLLIKYEVVRRLGDTEQIKYYLERIEGILGL